MQSDVDKMCPRVPREHKQEAHQQIRRQTWTFLRAQAVMCWSAGLPNSMK